MNAYVINLDKDISRIPFVYTTLIKFGFSPNYIHRFSAVEGKSVKHSTNMSDAEFGCTLSHIRIWQTALKKNLDFVAVFEDDIISYMENGLLKVLDIIKDLPPFDIFYLGKCNDKCDIYNPTDNRNVFQTFSPSCAHAYILSKRGLKKIHGKITKIIRSSSLRIVDDILQQLIRNKEIMAYTFHPSIFTQDILNNKSNLRNFDSSISNITECIRSFPTKKISIIIASMAVSLILLNFVIKLLKAKH